MGVIRGDRVRTDVGVSVMHWCIHVRKSNWLTEGLTRRLFDIIGEKKISFG